MELSSSSNYSRNEFFDHVKTRNVIRWKSGKLVDPRLLTLLESFEDIYVERNEFFKKIFPGDDDHGILFGKIGDAKAEKKKKTKKASIWRSQSIGSPIGIKGRGLDDGIDEFKVERFKVKTPIVIEEGEGGVNIKGSSNDSK